MSTFLVCNFPVSKSGQTNNQNLASVIGNDKKILTLSSQIKSGCGNEDSYFNYLQAIRDKGDLPVVTEYSNPFVKRHSQITNNSCYGEIAFTIWNFICLLINKTSTMPVSSQDDLLKIKPILSDLNALAEDLKFLSNKLPNHSLFSTGFTNFIESFVNFMNAQQVFQIAIFKQIDNSILKSGGTLLNQLQSCIKHLNGLSNGIEEYFRPEIKALIQYFNAYLYYRASLAQLKESSYGNAISSLRAASRILNPEDPSKSKWFHSSKDNDKITLSIINEKESLKSKIESTLKREEANNRNIYSQVIPDDPPSFPAAYKLNLFDATPALLFFCTVDIPGAPKERYRMTSTTQVQQNPSQSPQASPHTSQQIPSSQPLNQQQFSQTTNQPPQFLQQGNQQPQFLQQVNQQPQYPQATNQPPQFSQSGYHQPQFSPSASQNIQFTQQPNPQYPQNFQFYQQANQQPQFIQQTSQQIQFPQQPLQQTYANTQPHYPSMPINPQFSPFGSSDMFFQNNPNINTGQLYGQYPPYQNPNQYSNIPQSMPGNHFAQTMNANSFATHKSQSSGLPVYNQQQFGSPLTNCGSSPNFTNGPQPSFNGPQAFNYNQNTDPDQDFGGPPKFVPTAPPVSPEEIESQKTSSQHQQQPSQDGNPTFNQKPNSGPPVFTNQQGSAGGPPVFTNQQPPQRSSSSPPVFQSQQGSNGGPPVFTNQQGPTGGPPVFTNQQGSNGGPPVFTPQQPPQQKPSSSPPVFPSQQGSNGGPPVFTPQQKTNNSSPVFTNQQGSNGGPPVFTPQQPPQQKPNNSSPVFTNQQGSSGGPPVFTPPPQQQKPGSTVPSSSSPFFTPTDQPPAPLNGSGSIDNKATHTASGNPPPTFTQTNMNGPPAYTPFDQLNDEQIFPQMAKLKDLKQEVAMKIVDLSGTADEEIMNMVNMYAQQLSEAAVSDSEIDKLIQQYKQPGHSGIQSEFIEKAINGAIGFYTSINEQLVKVKQHS